MRNLLRALLPARTRDLARSLLGRNQPYGLAESELRRLQGLPRYAATEVKFFGRPLQVCDAASFLSAWREIFIEQIYRFRATGPEPLVIDAGANLGLASIASRQQYPGARVIALEPDPQICQLLRNNLQAHSAETVQILNCAAWDADESLLFAQDQADSGRVGLCGHVRVQGMRFLTLLEQHERVDFLKMDIEGAEVRVLLDCESELDRVENIFVEYHSAVAQPQQLSQLLGVLERAGFRYYVQQAGVCSRQPLLHRQAEAGFDLQLNIFGTRAAGDDSV